MHVKSHAVKPARGLHYVWLDTSFVLHCTLLMARLLRLPSVSLPYAVLKRIFSDSAEETASTSSACSSALSSSTSGSRGAFDMHGTFCNMLKGLPGAEDVVMGLDANLRHGQNSAPACQPDQPNTERMSSGVAWAETAAVVRHDSCDRAEDCPTNE